MCPRGGTPSAPVNAPTYAVSEMGNQFDLSMTDEKGETRPVKKSKEIDTSPVKVQSGLNMKVQDVSEK